MTPHQLDHEPHSGNITRAKVIPPTLSERIQSAAVGNTPTWPQMINSWVGWDDACEINRACDCWTFERLTNFEQRMFLLLASAALDT